MVKYIDNSIYLGYLLQQKFNVISLWKEALRIDTYETVHFSFFNDKLYDEH